ncbi:Cardio acceleratory peptide 2b [Frankliniella fusca]|uniref:Cardio acceleratory peptide 2b n=1 Tax=Frankliniella fusca TaxID=407009 RepID=A0AAE1GSF4_9NEOP|nr:Cardio acceleratory peptide 2b [Frankliniella fusca]
MQEYMLLLAAIALGARAGAADPLQDHAEDAPGPGVGDGLPDHHTRVQREVQGLFPFPRVGRATWGSMRDSGLGENKRQGLIPFPRVGRSENADPRNMPAAWLVAPEFYPGKRVASWMPSSSPRLGRQSKRFETDNAAWTLVNVRDYPAMNRPQRGRDSASFTPRLGRELESDEEVAVHDAPAVALGPGGEDLQLQGGVGVRL